MSVDAETTDMVECHLEMVDVYRNGVLPALADGDMGPVWDCLRDICKEASAAMDAVRPAVEAWTERPVRKCHLYCCCNEPKSEAETLKAVVGYLERVRDEPENLVPEYGIEVKNHADHLLYYIRVRHKL